MRAEIDGAALDVARDEGYYRRQAELLQQQLDQERGARPVSRRREQASERRGGDLVMFLAVVLMSIAIGVFGMLVWFDIPPAAILNPHQPTAARATPPAVRVNVVQPAAQHSAPEPEPPPVATSDYGIAAYNEAQQARAASFETPLPGEFWTEAEKAAFLAADATATAQAWADAQAATDAFIQDIPTPAPELVSEMEAKCADADLVSKNKLLQLWCPSIAAGED